MKNFIWLACFGLFACSSVEPTFTNEPKAIVEKKALARWDALIRADVNSAYKYLTPALRSTMSPERYREKVRAGLWRTAKVNAVTCQTDTCKAKVVVQYDLREIKGLEKEFEETWLNQGGDWWFVFKE